MSLGAFIKGITGMGLPLIAIPVMAAFLGVEHAVVVIAGPALLTNTWLLWEHRRGAGSLRYLSVLIGTGIIGAVAGTLLLVSVEDRWLSLALAAVILGYAMIFLLRPGFSIPDRVVRVTVGPVGLAAGALQGATGISGPLLATYLHGLRMERSGYVFSITLLFEVLGITQIVTLVSLGSFTASRLGESALALLPVLVAFPLGVRVSRKLSRKAFEYVVLALLVAVGFKLTLGGING
ncbi:MAG: sulfite exporter TauE/SafE family protein [Acidimicrobiia bacterium]|nr:sulfite exporter TauE/SafE family protein [Acidimicrobiia bacterium]